MTYDAVIIGGGAAGLFCAITAGKRGKRVGPLFEPIGQGVRYPIRLTCFLRCHARHDLVLSSSAAPVWRGRPPIQEIANGHQNTTEDLSVARDGVRCGSPRARSRGAVSLSPGRSRFFQ